MSDEWAEWADAKCVGFDWSAEGFHADSDGWEHHRFTVTLDVAGGERMSAAWRQGVGIYSDPTVGDVLEALVSDAQAGQQSFEDFAADFGYDPDSRRAYATWEACKRVAEDLVRLFGEIPSLDADA